MDRPATTVLLLGQFEIAWALAVHHLDGLTTAMGLWEPAAPCLHVRLREDGTWRPDRPESEDYAIGPPSIAWTTWHILSCWTTASAPLEDGAPVGMDDVPWPGDADRVRRAIHGLADRWRALVGAWDEDDLLCPRAGRWSIPDASPARIAARLNVELTKNAAEIGAMRFLHAVSGGR